MMKTVAPMWKDFNDFELATLAFDYGFKDDVEFDLLNDGFRLVDRGSLEQILTDYEMAQAFEV
jgi:hypothetical protein